VCGPGRRTIAGGKRAPVRVNSPAGRARLPCSTIRRGAVSAGQFGQPGLFEVLQQLTGVLEYSGSAGIS
jgi:hypothetical protein